MASGSLLNASIGEFRLVEFLGAGGMGEVYRAVHVKLGRAVAVKLLSAEGQGSGFLQRFWNEARLHSTLHHPNIAELYDFLEFGGRPCIVMEYIDGQTLSDRIRVCGGLSLTEAVPVFKAVVEAMAYVHEQGIVHRDIKAANVRINSSGVAKLLDFGIAKGEETPTVTKTGNVIGTLTYLAPELLRGGKATSRSDVWSLGLLFYEMVTGRLPFEAQAVGDLMDRLASSQYERLATCYSPRGTAEAALVRRADRLVARCLKKDPSDRYASAGELLTDLERLTDVQASGGVPAASVPGRDALAKVLALLERYWLHVSIAAVACLVVVILLIWPTRSADKQQPPPPTTTHEISVSVGKADVYVNGTFRGRTPYHYEAGPHETIKLELRQNGYQPYADTFDVTGRRVWTITMSRLPGRE